MTLEDLGYNNEFEQFRFANNLNDFEIGRVVAEHKERYIVKTAQGEYESEITGNMRFTARGREDFPAVGDWVVFIIYDGDTGIIHSILPRFSIIKRQAVGLHGDIQIIATNIDSAFLLQAVDRDFNVNRLERYLTICNSSGVKSVIVLTKIDLITETQLAQILEQIHARVKNLPIIAISNETQDGYEAIKLHIECGKTYCLLGSSGVGKSTLINKLSGKQILKIDSISDSTNRGRHISTHRELVLLDNGGILIDNPGMREVGVTDSSSGLELTFDEIYSLAQSCRFKDCTHTNEIGCAVLEAVKAGELNSESYQNFLKLEKEKAHFEATVEEKRKKDKDFGKMMKNYKKDIKRNKF